MWQGPAASRRWSPRSPSWGPRTGAVECPDPGSQWVLVLGVMMTWAISRGNAHSGARLEYPLINKVEHVVIESMECGMYHLIWGRMVMSVCPPGSDRFISNSWETQEGDAGTGSVRGCLGAYWEQVLCAPPWVLETLMNGYVLPFYTDPTPYVPPNQNSAQIEVEFVTNAVAELLKGGYIEEVKELPVVCTHYLWSPMEWQKTRLVVNLRQVNRISFETKIQVWRLACGNDYVQTRRVCFHLIWSLVIIMLMLQSVIVGTWVLNGVEVFTHLLFCHLVCLQHLMSSQR